MKTLRQYQSFPWFLFTIFLFLTTGILMTGLRIYLHEQSRLKSEAHNELAAIADLKVSQIVQWRHEQMGDGNVIRDNAPLMRQIVAFFKKGDGTKRKQELLTWMNSFRKHYGYGTILLLDTKGNIRLSTDIKDNSVGLFAKSYLPEIVQNREVIFTDLHKSEEAAYIHIDMLVPLISPDDKDSTVLGIVLLRIDPNIELFPLIQSWPTPSRTSETLLLEREENEIVYLNELRFKKNTALRLRLPVSDKELAGAMAARGIEGTVEGKNYRNVPVLAAIRKIPNSPWFMVAEVDQEEIYAPLRYQAWLVGGVVFLLIIATASIVGLWWRHQRAQFYREQYEAELERKALATHYDYLVRYANDIILLLHNDGRIIEANERACTSYGYTREEIVQLNVRDLRTPETRAMVGVQMKQVSEQKGMVFETEHQRKDGTAFPVEVSSRVIEIEGNNFFQSIIRDITERRQAEEALHESEEKYRSLVENSIEGIGLSKENRIIYANKALLGIFGYEKIEEFIAKPLLEHVAPESRSMVQELLRKAKKGEPHEQRFTYKIIHKDGTTRDLEIANDRIKIGSDIYTQSTFRDITERKQAEEELQKREAQQSLVLSSLPMAFYIAQPFGDYGGTWVSEQIDSICGFTAEQFKSDIHLWASRLHPEDRERVLGEFNKLNNKGSIEIEYRWQAADGQYVWFQDRAVLTRDEKGNPKEIIGTWLDITERKQAEEALRESEEKYKILFADARQAIFIADVETGTLIDCNEAACALIERSRDEIIGKHQSFLHPSRELIDGSSLSYRKHISDEAGQLLEDRVITKSGKIRDVEIKGNLVEFKGKKILQGFFIDITERKRAEVALRESEERFRRLIGSVTDYIYSVKLQDGRPLSTLHGPACVTVTGYTSEEYAADPYLWYRMVYKEDQQAVKNLTDQVLSGVEVPPLEHRIVHKNGSIRWVRNTLVLHRDDRGVLTSYDGLVTDITEHKLEEQVLRESEEQFRSLAEQSPNMIFINCKGRIVYANKRSEEIMGYTKDEFYAPEFNFLNIADPKFHDAMKEHFQRHLSGKETAPIEYVLLTKAGKRIDGILASKLISYKGEQAILGIITDITERKQAEELLRDSESRYRRLFETAQDAILILDAETGAVIDANPFIINLLGFSREDILGKQLWELGAFIDTLANKAAFEELQKKDYVRYENLPLQKKTGELIEVEFVSNVYLVDHKKVVQCNIRDITARKRAEKALLQSESLFKMLVESSPVAIVVYASKTKKIEFVSNRFTNIFGYVHHDMPSMGDWWRLAYPIEKHRKEIEKAWNENIEKAIREDREIVPIESTITCKDGYTKYIELTPSIIGDQTLVFFADLTQRRLAEEALRQTHAFNDMLIQTLPFGIDIIDEEGHILFLSKAMKDLLGADVIGMPCWTAYKDDKQQCQDCPLRRGLPLGKSDVIETSGVLGGKIFQISHIGIMYGGNKAILEIFQDITEQRKLQQELFQSQKMLSIGTLAGGIAHDFNNILGIILGYISILQSIQDNPERFSDGVNAIKQAVDRGAGLVRQILTFARKTEIAFEAMNIADLIKELVSMLQQTFPKIITFQTSFEQQLPYINADYTQIQQALLNLCVNARDAMPNGGQISIKAVTIAGPKLKEEYPGANYSQYVCIYVSDTGVGMEEATRSRVFDPFFTTKEKGKGTGLGLSVVYGIVQAHHGFIDLVSDVGKGSTFRVYLPVSQKHGTAALSQAKEENAIPRGNETILLVEDEDLLLGMVQTLLETHGYKVLTARDGIEAVEMYKKYHSEISLVLTDMGLPKLTGTEEFNKLKEINPNVKLIFASGYFEPEAKAQLVKAGAKGFLQKPYIIEEVLKRIREATESK